MLYESKVIEYLKRAYDEKLKKLRQKEKKERIYKKLPSALLKDFKECNNFLNEFYTLIEKLNCKNTKNAMKIINSSYNFNQNIDTINEAKKQ